METDLFTQRPNICREDSGCDALDPQPNITHQSLRRDRTGLAGLHVPGSLRRDGETCLAGGVRISAKLLLHECEAMGNCVDMHECAFHGGDCKEEKTKQVKLQMRLIIMRDHCWTVG